MTMKFQRLSFWVLKILFIINCISILILLLSLKKISNEIILFPFLIILIFNLFIVLKRKYIYNLNYDKKTILFSFFLSILFLLIIPINYCYYKITIFNNILILNCIIKVLISLSVFMSVFYILVFLFSYTCHPSVNCSHMRKKLMLFIIIISILFICSTSTGFYDWDFKYIWNISDDWDNWHTFGFNFLVYICKVIFKSPYPIIIFNFILYIFFCDYSFKIIERVCKNKNILLLYFLIILFTLVGFDQLRYILKDVLFSLSFCILIVTIIDYITLGKFNKKIIVNLFLFSVLTLLFRHGTLYLLFFIFMSIFILITYKKQYFYYIYFFINVTLIIVVYLIINYIGFNILNGRKYPLNFTYTIPIYQIGAFLDNGYVFSENDAKYLEQYLPINYMKENFEKYNGDKLTRSWYITEYETNAYTFDYSKLININYKLLRSDPMFYVKSLLDLTNILWKIEVDDRDYWPIEYTEYFYKFDWNLDEYLKDKTIMYKESSVNVFIDFIINIFLKSFLFNMRVRGGIPLFILLVSLFIFIKKKRYLLMLPIFILLFWYACLFLSIPASITRYCLPFTNIYPFVLCLSLGVSINNEN